MSKLMKWLAGLAVACSTLAAGSAQAALLGVVQNFSDVSLSNNTLIYDANGVNATTGLLRVVSLASTLNRAPGQATTAQSYLGTGDSVADVMLTFAIDNTTGALVSNSTYNKVQIGFGNSAIANPASFGFSWQGNVTAFGALANGTAFDAQWTMSTDSYQALASSGLAGAAASFSNGGLAGMPGGLKITNSGAIAGANIWAFDWVRGQFAGTTGSAYAAQIAPLITAATMTTSADRLNSTVVADVFVPLPAAAWLLFSGLVALIPATRRREVHA